MFKVITDYPFATHSPDFITPHGSKVDNFGNERFVIECENMFGQKLNVLDIGCSGGKQIREFHNRGHLAVGLEGSDYPFKTQRAEWRYISNNLFCCDCSQPFEILYNEQRFKCDIISMFGVIEHFTEEQLPRLFENILNHIKPNGILINCIGLLPDKSWHQTVKPKEWWLDLIVSYGFVERHDIMFNLTPVWPRQDSPNTVHNCVHQYKVDQ